MSEPSVPSAVPAGSKPKAAIRKASARPADAKKRDASPQKKPETARERDYQRSTEHHDDDKESTTYSASSSSLSSSSSGSSTAAAPSSKQTAGGGTASHLPSGNGAASSSLVKTDPRFPHVPMDNPNYRYVKPDSKELTYFRNIRVPDLDDEDQTSDVYVTCDGKGENPRIMDKRRNAPLVVTTPFMLLGGGNKLWPFGNMTFDGKTASGKTSGEFDAKTFDVGQISFQATTSAYDPKTLIPGTAIDSEAKCFAEWSVRVQRYAMWTGRSTVARLKHKMEEMRKQQATALKSAEYKDDEKKKERYIFEQLYSFGTNFIFGSKIGGETTDQGTAMYIQDYLCTKDRSRGAKIVDEEKKTRPAMVKCMARLQAPGRNLYFLVNNFMNYKMDVIDFWQRFDEKGQSTIGAGDVISFTIALKFDGNKATAAHKCGIKPWFESAILYRQGIKAVIPHEDSPVPNGEPFVPRPAAVLSLTDGSTENQKNPLQLLLCDSAHNANDKKKD